MKYFFAPIALAFLILFSFITPSFALTATPSVSTVAPNSTITINLTTSQAAEGATIRLVVANATITSYTAPAGAGGADILGTCTAYPEEAKFTSSNVCFDVSVPVTSGQSLGTITIQVGSSGTATLTKQAENAYIVNSARQANTGVAGTYTISSTAPTTVPRVTTLPRTGILDETLLSQPNLIYLGSVFLVAGVALFAHQYYTYMIKTDEE